MKKTLLTIILLLPLSLQAQESPITGTIDLVNQYLWRGSYQAGASLQPEAVVSLKNWEFSIWGTTSFGEAEKEIDLTLKYSWQHFNIGITDYWFGKAEAFYGKGHLPEIGLGYDFSTIPLSLSYSLVLYGDNKQFSPYAEIVFSPLWKELQLEFTAGATPWANAMLETGQFAVTNLTASIRKALNPTGATPLEIYTTLIYNPAKDTAFWIAGISVPF
jgi:hypothetical protein